MNQRKKQHVVWGRQLERYLSRITWCERCKSTPRHLETAHRLKRRFIGWRSAEDHLEYFMAAKLCRKCHVDLDEFKGEDAHKRMFDVITRIVIDRRLAFINGPRMISPFLDWDPVRVYSYAR